MSDKKKTALITGASHGIGAGLADAFLKEGYNVVATALDASESLTASPSLVLVDGDISKQETSAKTVDAAIQHFGTIDVLVNNAGIYRTKVFTDFTTDDFNALVSTNLLGFLYMTQLTVKQMLKQKSGNVVTISAALADQPIAGMILFRVQAETNYPWPARQAMQPTSVGGQTGEPLLQLLNHRS